MRNFLIEMRPKQWIKNLLVYAALIFDGRLFQAESLLPTTLMFIAFCLMSSAVYFVNDIFDIEIDRLNPKKKLRPIASGAISRRDGYIFALILFAIGIGISARINLECLTVAVVYVAMNLLYTVRLKHVVVLDVMIVAACFGLRAISGALAATIPMTVWFVLCVIFLSLFLIIGKRRDELYRLTENELERGRAVLKFYTLELLDQMMTITATALLMSYSLFAVDPGTRDHLKMALTVPLVIYGVFYYLYAVKVEHRGGAPDEMLWKERPILFTAIIYFVYVIVIRTH